MDAEQAANAKQQIGRACNLCRLSHTACESTRPCRRCIAIGKAHLCADVEMRKRGRPRKAGSSGQDGGKHSSKRKSTSARETEDSSSNDGDALMRKTQPGASEWQSAATAKRPRIETAEGFKIRMPSLGFDPFDPFQAPALAATASSSSMVSVSMTAASNLHSHSERISNISSSFFGLASPSPSPSTATSREAFSSAFASYSVNGTSSSSSSSSSSTATGQSFSAMSYDLSSSSSSSSPPSSPYSSSSSSPSSSFDSSNQSLLNSLSSTLLRGGSNSANNTDRNREDVLEGILSLVLEELREVKQHNRDMRKQLGKVTKRQAKTEQQLLQISSSSSSSSSTFPHPAAQSSASASVPSAASSKQPEGILTISALSDILNRMPFLLDYSVSPSTFVVNDARKPFYALRIISQYIGEDSSPPIFIFVNNSFAELSGYALNELLGRNVNKVSCVDDQGKKEMLSKLFQSAPQTISEPFSLQIMMRRKDGKVLRCNSRHQAFYNELGYIRWCVTVVDSYTELNIRSEDLSLDWTPPIAWAQAALGNRPPSANTPFTSSPASSSSPSACQTPGSENTSFTSPTALPSHPSYPSHFNQQPPPSAMPYEAHQQQNQQQQQPPPLPPQHNPMPSYQQPPHSMTSAPSPLFSGADDRIDLQELLLQLIPPSPSMPAYGMPMTPSSSSSSSLSTSSSSVGSSSSANSAASNHQPPGSGGASEYSWLKDLQQMQAAAHSHHPQPSNTTIPTTSSNNNSWFDADA